MSDPAVTRVSGKCRNRHWFFQPLLAPILLKPKIICVFIGVGILQIALTATGLRGWPCPIDTVLDIPCPGCRLSTALMLLIQGKWQSAVQLHGLAPVFLAGLIAFAVFSVLPVGWRTRAAHQIAFLENRTGFAAAIILSGVIYWSMRCAIGF